MKPAKSGSQDRVGNSAYRALVLAGLLTAFLLRLYRLGAASLWYDETVSAYLASQSFSDIIAHTALDIHPPGYYLLLHVWSLVSAPLPTLGLEFLLAFPSLWFGVLTVALLAPLGRTLLGKAPAALAVWLAAFSPFLIWYGQEVRMYTAASALCLVCLLAALRFTAHVDRHPRPPGTGAKVAKWLGVYSIAAAASLYTLYFTAFALVAINVAVLYTLVRWSSSRTRIGRALAGWASAQAAALILFSPWLPLALRQVLMPPVPPWRTPWQLTWDAAPDAASVVTAYAFGQSAPNSLVWMLAGFVVVVLVAYYGYTKSLGVSPPLAASSDFSHWAPIFVFVPPLAVALISVFWVPIFHVRYLATYAPAFALLSAAAMVYLLARRRTVFALMAALLVAGTASSLHRYWNHPDFQPDDHRSAVAALAHDRRPGDAILVNAGWVYTAVDTYWPKKLVGPFDAVPDGPVNWLRVTQAEQLRERWAAGESTLDLGPVHGLTTGSVDGDESLGWGSPDADFFATERVETLNSLQTMSEFFARVWHYRLYDTVSDPDGAIRGWLASNLVPTTNETFAGDGFLRLESYATQIARVEPSPGTRQSIPVGSALLLDDFSVPEAAAAGSYLYVPLTLHGAVSPAAETPVGTSLRLIDADSRLWAQKDERIALTAETWNMGERFHQVLALPIPASTPPGAYDVQLVFYAVEDLAPVERSHR